MPSQGDPPPQPTATAPVAVDGAFFSNISYNTNPNQPLRPNRGLFPRSMLWVSPLFFLAMVNTWYSSKATGNGKYTEVMRSQIPKNLLPPNNTASGSNHGFAGQRIRNPATTDASPLCTEEQRHKIAHQLLLIKDEDIVVKDVKTTVPLSRTSLTIVNTDMSSLKAKEWTRMRWFRCPKASWIDHFYSEGI